ncbi:MAG: 50S ribosomal protein L19e [Nanoarchaeota archaeon]|nr:50S ribosomal protein L19e [Nanoarchaeota archaeon]
MKLTLQKRLASRILKCSPKKIKIDTSRMEEIKEAITKKDIKSLIKDKAIEKKKTQESSRARARKIKKQKSKGKRKGKGSKKGKINSKISKKDRWMLKIRTQRKLLRELRSSEKIDKKTFGGLYMKSKGGFFRSRRHIQLYIKEHNLAKK